MDAPTIKTIYFCEKCGLTRDFSIGTHRTGWLGIYGAICKGSPSKRTYILNDKVTA